jgi:hypothetical protein
MEIFTETQLLALLICAALAIIGYKVKQPGISLISGIGLFILGFQIYQSSSDILLLGLMVMLAVSQFIITVSYSMGRR